MAKPETRQEPPPTKPEWTDATLVAVKLPAELRVACPRCAVPATVCESAAAGISYMRCKICGERFSKRLGPDGKVQVKFIHPKRT